MGCSSLMRCFGDYKADHKRERDEAGCPMKGEGAPRCDEEDWFCRSARLPAVLGSC